MKQGKYVNKAARSVQKQKTPPVFLLFAAIGLLVIGGFLVFRMAANASRLDVFDYIDIQFSGYNTNGEAKVDFAKPDMIETILMEDSDTNTSWLIQYDVYDRGIQVKCHPEEGLSNGDKVKVTVTVSENAGKKVRGGEREYTVEGLPDVETVDIFADVALIFEGIGELARARLQVTSDNELLQRCIFRVEPEYGICNGDTVTVTLQNPELLAEQFLCVPTETVRTFPVSGLDEYLTDPDLLPEEDIRDIITRFLAENVEEDSSWISYSIPVYYKTYFLTAQEGSFLTEENMLQIFIYREQFDRGEHLRDQYIPLVFRNLILKTDGTVELDYEKSSTAFYYTEPENILNQADEGYDIEEIYIEY